MKKIETRVTELLGIDYPIICGGLNFISRAEFIAAVANTGAFGILTSAHLHTAEALREEIRKTKRLTDRPFGVNINLFPSAVPLPNEQFIEVIIEEGVQAAETSGRQTPAAFMKRLKEGGVKVIHKAATVRHALKGEQTGADIITIVGLENGGATGLEEIGTQVLVPILVDKATVPVIAGGGFADGRGLVSALALGAEGVVLGTRFIATQECPVHPNYKQWILDASERDTVLVMKSIRNAHRALKTATTEKLAEMEEQGATLEDIMPIISGEAMQKTGLEGDQSAGVAYAGEAVGLIHDIPTVKELVERIVSEARSITERLAGL